MESEKPRGISILAVESAKPRGIAIPAVRAVAADAAFILTRTLSGTFSVDSVPIRAPLTLDDDDDDESGSEHLLASSDASSYSKRLDSGSDDGFESVSGEADDEAEIENEIMGGIRVIGEELGGGSGDRSDFSGGSVVYKPFSGDIEEETSVHYSSFEEESDEVEGVSEGEDSEAESADIVSVKAKVVIPRAVLSLDDDEFDEILGSEDDEDVLLRVTKDLGDDGTEVEDRTLQFGDVVMVEEPECLDSVIGDVVFTEKKVVRMNSSDKLEGSPISISNIEDLSPFVSSGGSNDFKVENERNLIEASTGLNQSFKQPREQEVLQQSIIEEDGGGSIHGLDVSMKSGDVEGGAVEVGEMGMTDKPEFLSSVTHELVSTMEDMRESSLGAPAEGSNDSMVENEGKFIESSTELDQSSKQSIEKGVVHGTTTKEDSSGSNHEFDALINLGDVERVEDSEVELGEMVMTDKLEDSGCVTGELVSTEEDKQVNDRLVFIETVEENSLGVAIGDYNDFLVEGKGNDVDAHRGLDETHSQLVEQGVGQGSLSKKNDDRIDCGSSFDANESMILCEDFIELGRRESGDEDTGNMISKGEPESFQMTLTLDSATTMNIEVAGGIEAVISGCGSSEQESITEGNQEPRDIDRKLSLPDNILSLRSSFESGNESVENGEQVSEQNNKQVNFQSDSEPNQISAGIEETSLLSVKGVGKIMPENSSVIACDIMENETEMARLIHNHTFMELDEYKEAGDTREKLSESTFQKFFEELSSNSSVELISEKVKERVEKTQLLKEKLQRIIRRTGHCSENSTLSKVVSKLSLAGEEHQTFVDDLDVSINVLVIGKTGVGKSATVNSIFGETKSPVGAFGVTTKSANYVAGNVGGIMIKILDTPGLVYSATEERFNQEVLMSIKKSMRTFPVDVILYIGRLDENPDIHLLRTITSTLGPSIWRKTILVLTHAASDVLDSPSYEDFISQRSSLMHHSIRQAVSELSCVDKSKMPEIVLAENNMSSLSGNKISKATCPDWRLNLLILCCSVKMRSKTDSLQKKNTFEEKSGVLGSQLRSFTVFCSLWNVLLLGTNSGKTSHSHEEEKKRHLVVGSYREILWDEQSQEYLEQETQPAKNQEPEDEERQNENGKTNRVSEKGVTVVGRVRSRRGRLGFQATKMFGIYLDTSGLQTGFSIGNRGYRKEEEQEEGKRILVRMRGSLAILGLVPMLLSVLTCVYGRKII